MKKGLMTLALTGLVLGGAITANAYTVTLDDNYTDEAGAKYYGTDSIGAGGSAGPAAFDIAKTVVTVEGTKVTFQLLSLDGGGYFQAGRGLYGFGDLFLDTNGGKNWNYSVRLDPIAAKTGLTGTTALYSVAAGGSIDYGYERTIPVNGVDVKNQAALFTPGTGNGSLANSEWGMGGITIDNTSYLYLSITTNLPKTVWDGTTALGFHWTMECANDVVQDVLTPTPVPEPSSLLLFGTGIAGLAGFARRQVKR